MDVIDCHGHPRAHALAPDPAPVLVPDPGLVPGLLYPLHIVGEATSRLPVEGQRGPSGDAPRHCRCPHIVTRIVLVPVPVRARLFVVLSTVCLRGGGPQATNGAELGSIAGGDLARGVILYAPVVLALGRSLGHAPGPCRILHIRGTAKAGVALGQSAARGGGAGVVTTSGTAGPGHQKISKNLCV